MTNHVIKNYILNSAPLISILEILAILLILNPFSLQISSQLVTIGAGGRGEALRSAPTPQGVKGVPRLLQAPV